MTFGGVYNCVRFNTCIYSTQSGCRTVHHSRNSFSSVQLLSRIGYDFKTGEKNVYIDGGASPFFGASENLKKATNANYLERLEMGEALLAEE